MEAHAEQLKPQSPQLHLQPRQLPERRLALVGTLLV
jgi:hypothetical protein